MKKQSLIFFFTGCLLCLSACQAQADVQATPAPKPHPAPAERPGDEKAQELAEAEREYQEEVAEIQQEWAEEQKELREELAELEREWADGEYDSREEMAEELQDYHEEMADAQMEMREALEEARKELKKAKVHLSDGMLRSSGSNFKIAVPDFDIFASPSHGTTHKTRLVFIPDKPTDAEFIGQRSEDMQVMAMIFKEAAGPNEAAGDYERYRRRPNVMRGTGFFGSPVQSSPEAIWLDGYGVVFTLEVDFPLVAAGNDEETQPEQTDDKTDEVWQRSKKRLKGEEPDETKGEKEMVVFDPDKVKQLQEKLTDALKHASNIRSLSAKDRIVVVVRSMIDGDFLYLPAVRGEAQKKDAVSVPTSVMTLQAAKQDIDAFAAEKMDLDAFTKRVAVVIY